MNIDSSERKNQYQSNNIIYFQQVFCNRETQLAEKINQKPNCCHFITFVHYKLYVRNKYMRHIPSDKTKINIV